MQYMKNTVFAFVLLLLFVVCSGLLFAVHYFLAEQNILVLNYKIHFLMTFVTFICIATLLVVFLLKKKDIIGFVFLGFVIFKFFAMGYIAVFQPDFKQHIVPYFVLYWVYLAMEVVLVLKLLRKQD